jgi:hypothetical protein
MARPNACALRGHSAVGGAALECGTLRCFPPQGARLRCPCRCGRGNACPIWHAAGLPLEGPRKRIQCARKRTRAGGRTLRFLSWGVQRTLTRRRRWRRPRVQATGQGGLRSPRHAGHPRAHHPAVDALLPRVARRLVRHLIRRPRREGPWGGRRHNRLLTTSKRAPDLQRWRGSVRASRPNAGNQLRAVCAMRVWGGEFICRLLPPPTPGSA